MFAKVYLVPTILASALVAGSAIAAVSPEEAKQLGGPVLTVFGAEKAGNKEGTIPPYTGTDRPKAPASYDPKYPGTMPDPYADEKPLFTITAQNMAQYADKLTDGQKELFKRYPSFRMVVYPTHRSATHAPTVLEATMKNATSCKGANKELRLEGCYGGFPFPIPKSGNQVVWNHMLSHPGPSWGGSVGSYITDTSGKIVHQVTYEVAQEAPYLYPENKSVLASNSIYWKLRLDAVGPARRIGEKILILDGLDPLDPGRRAWQYVPGQRRVKLAPDLAYDTPSPASGGAATIDQQRIFLGAQDRYDMKLIGKKEIFMPYNNYQMTDYRVCPLEKYMTKNFNNPDCLRFELHRAWVMQATLKPGFRHTLPKRMFYFDEDTWNAGWGDSWDAANKLYRVDTHGLIPFYVSPYGQNSDSNITYDLQTGAVSNAGFWAYKGGGYAFTPQNPNKTFFSPEALAGEGIR